MAAGTAGVRIEIDDKSMSRLKRAFTVLGEKDAPFLRAALDAVGVRLTAAARTRARGGIGARVQYIGVRGQGASLRAMGRVQHPGSRSMEFGRQWYYTGYRGRRASTGRKVVRRGQRARPYLGVMGGGASADIAPFAREHILDAIGKEWDRIGAGGT